MTERVSVEDRLRAAGLAEPAADLRDRVLAATTPLVQRAARATWADHVWFSRHWRLAAVALLFALIALDRVSAIPRPADAAPGPTAVQTARAADEAARQVGLTSDQAGALARRVLFAASRPAAGSQPSIDELIREQR